MTILATLFDTNYASRGYSMLSSTGISADSWRVLALNGLEDNVVGKLQAMGAGVLSEQELIASNQKLLSGLRGRSRPEEIFTMGPSFLKECMKESRDGEWVVYLDADLFFLAGVEEFIQTAGDSSVILVPHRHYPWNKGRLAKFGEYNVGLVAFRNDPVGRKALDFWSQSCIDWCKDSPEDGKYADQKYLEAIARMGPRVHIAHEIGANLAPWNSDLHKIGRAGKGLVVDRAPLYFFHAQGLKRLSGGWMLGHLQYLSFARNALVKHVYHPYFDSLKRSSDLLGVPVGGSARQSDTFLGRVLTRLSLMVSGALGQIVRDS